MLTFDVRKESFGAIVFDKMFYCFALIGNKHYDLLNSTIRGNDVVGRLSEYKELLLGGYLDGTRKKHLPSLANIPTNLASHLSAPLAIGLIVTSKCNLDCKYCYARSNPVAEMSERDIQLIADRLSNSRVMACWISGGEPTLWPYLPRLIKVLGSRNIPVAIDSNGLKRSAKVLEEIADYGAFIRISLDSHKPEVHDSVRGNFHETWDTLKYLAASDRRIGVITVVHNQNAKYLKDFAHSLADIGIHRWTVLELNDVRLNSDYRKMLCLSASVFERYVSETFADSSSLGIIMTIIRGTKPRSTLLVGPDKYYYTVSGKGRGREILGRMNNEEICDIWSKRQGISKPAHLLKYLGMQVDRRK